MKKTRKLVLAGILAVSMLTACAPGEKGVVDYSVHKDEILGLTLELPTKELEDWTVLYGPFDQSVDRGPYAPVDGCEMFFMPMECDVTLFAIQYYEEEKWDGWLADGHTAAELTGVPDTSEIGHKDGMVYIYTCPAPDDSSMNDTQKEEYQNILKMLPHIHDSITLTVRETANMGNFPAFSTTDLNGEAADSSLWEDYEITMVNIWGTFCGPCIEEMPDLEKLSQSLPDGANIIGIVTDALDEEHIALAGKIVEETGASYRNLIPDQALADYLDNYITGVPATLFLDANGQVVGDAVIGVRGMESYLEELSSRMKP